MKTLFSNNISSKYFVYTLQIDGAHLVLNGAPLADQGGARAVAARMRAAADAIDKAAGVLESEGRLVPLQK